MGPQSVGLDPPPIAFIDKARPRERGTFAFYQVLEQGIDGTSMESFADHPPQDRWDLALYAGTFAFSASKVAEGERIWKSDAALRGRINLEKLVGMTPAALAAEIGEVRADAVIAYLPQPVRRGATDRRHADARAYPPQRSRHGLCAWRPQARPRRTSLPVPHP